MTNGSGEYDLAIALAIGTSFSGYSLQFLNGESVPNSISPENPVSGYYVPKIKLLLNSNSRKDLPPLPQNMKPAQIIGDYLRRTFEHIRTQVPAKYFEGNSKFNYKIFIAAPTIWSKESKDIIREAAILGGLFTKHDESEKLSIVDEAVAAALGVESASSELNLIHGNIYMVCDAGGGTVDIATFKKDDSSGASGLKEVSPGISSTCGSTLLDTRFENLVREKVSRSLKYSEVYIQPALDYFKNELKKKFCGDGHLYGDSFNYIDNDCYHYGRVYKKIWATKHSMDLSNVYSTQELIEAESSYGTKVPDDVLREISDYEIFTADEIRIKVFDPVVNKVLDTIEKQFKQLGDITLDVMFITGGFGQSPYLKTRIIDTFRSRVNYFKITENEKSAVLSGTLLFGCNQYTPTQHTLRQTYGVKLCSIHDKSDKDMKSEKDKFHVHIRKGESVREDFWVTKSMVWKESIPPIISLCEYNGNDPVPEYPAEKDIGLVAIFNTKFKLYGIKNTEEVMVIQMRFGLDDIEFKVEISGKDLEYFAVWDLSKKNRMKGWSEPKNPFSPKATKTSLPTCSCRIDHSQIP
ncbi:hypothetical protein J3Q64DRAFT_1852069 [Phycomyces blakesleeanus]|uniref:Actin-like ATPase domain-containing protein n=1 Tax=Phycomyces blakesleeanus TaxID=4837 RepID=A0ABR3AP40_PHYBL